MTRVSKTADVSYSTVKRWIEWYRVDGIDEVLKRIPGHGADGARPFLTRKQQEELRAKVNSGAFATAHEVRRWVMQQWQVAYTVKGIYSLLRRMGISLKDPVQRVKEETTQEK